MFSVKKFETKEELITNGRVALENYLLVCKTNDERVLLCLSGGSALELLKDFNHVVLGDNVTLTVLDERFSSDPAISNMAQIEATGFLDKARQQGCTVIDTKVAIGETIDDVVVRFNQDLSQWIKNNQGGRIVATAGMGPDGHTSGIIPGSENFESLFMVSGEKLVVGYKAANQPEDRNRRITTNFDFLRSVSFAILVVMGDEKIPAKDRLMADAGTLRDTPARIWREVRGDVLMFTNL